MRIYGKEDLRLEEFELPKIKDTEILASVVTDSICMSSYKLAKQGAKHKRAPENLSQHPAIIGHEMCGEILEVGDKWKSKYKKGSKYVMQVNLPNQLATPGYSYEYVGGSATYVIIPEEVMENDSLIAYNGETFYEGSLVEPLSCVIAAFKSNYHVHGDSKVHKMGIKENGTMLMMGAIGPMGSLAIDVALKGPKRPKKLVVTDIDQDKIDRAKRLYTSEEVDLEFVNTSKGEDPEALLRSYNDGQGFDDIFVFVPLPKLMTLASALLNADGCINFFAGPSDKNLMAEINIYGIHYNDHHYVGTSGGDIQDMKDAVQLIEEKKVDVSKVITHVLGLSKVANVTLKQVEMGGGKKMVYTHKEMALIDLNNLSASKEAKGELEEILHNNGGLWSKEAEEYILTNMKKI